MHYCNASLQMRCQYFFASDSWSRPKDEPFKVTSRPPGDSSSSVAKEVLLGQSQNKAAVLRCHSIGEICGLLLSMELHRSIRFCNVGLFNLTCIIPNRKRSRLFLVVMCYFFQTSQRLRTEITG